MLEQVLNVADVRVAQLEALGCLATVCELLSQRLHYVILPSRRSLL